MKRIIILAALVFWAFGAHAQTNDNALNQSRSIIGSQIMAFQNRAHEEAFAYAAPGIRQSFRDVSNFITMVKRGFSPIYYARSWAYGRSRIDGDIVYHEVLISGPQGNEWVALYALMLQADGSWKITSVRLLQSNAKST